jgi:hypothetical protein
VKPAAVARAEALLGSAATSWAAAARRGYSVSEHWLVSLEDGRRVFLKECHVDPSPQWLREERDVYRELSGPFMPGFVGFEDGDAPLLVLEALDDAYWPPPWRPGDVEAVLATLAEVARLRADLPPIEHERPWHAIARDPAPFLSTDLRDRAWLERRLPRLQDAADAAPLAGDAVLHRDVRSDNLCLVDGRAILVDWNHASTGDPGYDVAFWLPSLVLEGGPGPDGFGVDAFAAYVAGWFAARAGLPPPAGAPTVRAFQRAQAAVALDWTERVL